jgi:hypothetical protein
MGALFKRHSINMRPLLLSGLLISSLAPYPQRAAIAAERIAVPQVRGPASGKGPGSIVSPAREYQVYTVPEVDAMISILRSETAENAKGLRTESEALKNSIKEQVLQTLNGVSEKLLSDDLKNKLSADISDSIAQKVNLELEQFKVDLTKEILATVDARINKVKELQGGQQ